MVLSTSFRGTKRRTTNLSASCGTKNVDKAIRWARALWPLVFLIPLGFLAGRLCSVNAVDPTYHTLVWLHERLIPIVILLAIASVGGALYKFLCVQRSIRVLFSLCITPPPELEQIFDSAMMAHYCDADLLYIDVPRRFCFTIFRGPSIVISRGFAETMSRDELAMVAEHEVFHVQRKDPWRSIGWHLFLAGLVLPGFESLETFLHLRRERVVDAKVIAETANPVGYQDLLVRCSKRRDRLYGMICTSGVGTHSQSTDLGQASLPFLLERSLPAMISVSLILLVFFSHAMFMHSLPYLQAHHC